jgi:hypothetical protein
MIEATMRVEILCDEELKELKEEKDKKMNHKLFAGND